MTEYRPCIVTETAYPPYGEQGIIEHKKHKALFHQWLKRTRPNYEETPFGDDGWMARKFVGNDEFLVAVVEYEDGTIHEHLPWEIQFTDREDEKNFKNKKDGWNKLTEDEKNYPNFGEKVKFKTSDGRICDGSLGFDMNWYPSCEKDCKIKDVVEWREL